MLEWTERGIADRADQKIELETLSEVIEQGCKKHPTNAHLKTLREKVRHAYLLLSVSK